jgi:DNA-binding transcriptional LysR family regulator
VTSLFVEEFVTVVGLEHPLAGRTEINAADIAASFRIAYGQDALFVQGGLRDAAPFEDNAGPVFTMVQQFTALPLLVLLCSALAIVPRRLAEVMATCMPLRLLEGGVGPVRVDMAIVWTRRHDSDPDHRWFRELIIEHLRDDRFR